jgi:hypothetical protein
MILVDPSANHARTIAASAEDLWLLLDSVQFAPGHRPSLWSRLRLYGHRLILQTSIRTLCAWFLSEHIPLLVCPAVAPPNLGWAENEIEALRKSSPLPIVMYRRECDVSSSEENVLLPL